MFKKRLIISILITAVIMTSFDSNWLQTNAKKTHMREAFAINNMTFHQKMKATKISANGSFGSLPVTVPKNATTNTPFISSYLGVIVGGILGFVSAVGADWVKRWYMRPKIIIDDDTTEVDILLKKREIRSIVPDPQIPTRELEYSYIGYSGTRVKVKNDGRSAAKGCKATLITDQTEFRAGWMIPEQDYTVTINAYDVEYLDLCAISQDGTDRVFTTERGYDYVDSGRRLDGRVIDAKLKVSAKNAEQCVKSIRIFDIRDTENKIVRLSG